MPDPMIEDALPAAGEDQRRLILVGLSSGEDGRLRSELELVSSALECAVVAPRTASGAGVDARSARRAGALPVVLEGDELGDGELAVLLRSCGGGSRQSPLVRLVGGDLAERGRQALEAGACDVLPSGEWRTDDLVRSLRFAFELALRLRAEERLREALEGGKGLDLEWTEEARRYVGSGRLLIAASHDLSNLLQPILGHAELLVALHRDTVSGRYAQLITHSAALAATLVRRLLMLGRLGGIARTELDADQTLNGLDGLLCLLLGPKIRYDSYLGAPGVRLELPEGALEQIVLNLVANARDAMPRGGRVAIRTRPTDRGWRLEVEDDGLGIEPTRLGEVFDSGYTTKREHRGAGLGLWIVRSLVEESGGDVVLASEPGRGTTVRVELPAMPRRMPPTAA